MRLRELVPVEARSRRPQECDRLGVRATQRKLVAKQTVAVAGATTGQYGAIWAQQDLRRVLGICDAPGDRRRPSGPESGQTVFDENGNLRDALVAERLRAHLAAVVAEAEPVAVAAA